jgi:hypothetical protein
VDEEAPPPPAEELVLALFVHLLRSGAISEADVLAMGENLSEGAKHLANCTILEAAAPSQSEWRAEMARKRFVIVPNDGDAG